MNNDDRDSCLADPQMAVEHGNSWTVWLPPASTVQAADPYVEDWDDAILLLRDDLNVGPVGKHWRNRAELHLSARLNKVLRQHLPIQPPSNEQVAMSLIKDMARNLQEAGRALEQAAKVIKDCGKGHTAGQVYLAGQKAKQQAAELIGEQG